MRLSQFILSNLDEIAKEWEAFARTLSPSRSLSSHAVRDDLERMLRFIAADIESAQTDGQQRDKAQGHGPELPGNALSAAHEHGLQRLAQSFTLVETISEFRALRASVTRLWLAMGYSDDRAQELIRFNEAMDQIVAESVLQFTGKLDRDRELLLGMVTHDLRNPLSVITSSGELLLRWPAGRSSAEIADRITHAARRMESIIKHLDFTRTRLGTQLPLTAGDCDLAEIARATAKELSADGHITVSARGDCTGRWDRGRITQLVANLLGNALQHGNSNAPVSVEITGEEADAVHMWVRNAGPMIPRDEREAIFQPMLRGAAARTNPSHKTSLGLGLFIVRQIACAHGGAVELASSDERETVFHVLLPRDASD